MTGLTEILDRRAATRAAKTARRTARRIANAQERLAVFAARRNAAPDQYSEFDQIREALAFCEIALTGNEDETLEAYKHSLNVCIEYINENVGL